MTRQSRHVHNDRLGYVPRPGHAEPGLTIDSAGLRRTGEPPAGMAALPPILAVGDSFTFGEGVSDLDTWPAALQRLSDRPVLNGGVSGYGFDQIVLRAEQLAAECKPSVIVAGVIADDIGRTEMRRLWWHDKPWFALEHGELVPRGVPVPDRDDRGWRHFASFPPFEHALRRLAPLLQDWFGYHVRVHAAGLGERIAGRLTERLAALQRTSGARVIVVAQYDAMAWKDSFFAGEQRRLTKGLLDCATANGIETIDSFAALAAAPRPRQLYGQWHMNEAGNFAIARLIAATLATRRYET
jgi:hypothetical protein